MKYLSGEKLAQEAGLLDRLRHPNIVLFMGVTSEQDGLVTEYVQHTLYELVHVH